MEVLDWGGSGRPLVLLAGGGDMAHVFDDFAPKLTPNFHVYGITRRSFGASGFSADGYGADRLGDDVLAVLDWLKLIRPVLVGHSLGGNIATRYAGIFPENVKRLVSIEGLGWRAPAKGLAGSCVELGRNVVEVVAAIDG